MKKITMIPICLAACLAIASSGKAQVVTGSEVYSNGWFRNNTIGTGLYNTATGTGIYSPAPGSVATYNNGHFTANSIYSNDWFRNSKAGTGLYNAATGTGIYSPAPGSVATYNNGHFTANSIYSNDWFRNTYMGTGMVNSATGTGIYSPAMGMMATYNNGGFIVGSVNSTPAGYKLYVSQGILTEKIKVAVNGTAQWADYVFAKDYKLMPLAKVELYIKANQHLPNVPSAADMVKEGNDLGKTTAKLLEKIEELTLYMIEMKKENQLQQREIEVLKSKLDFSTTKK
jgi:hypothetical protein